MEFALTVWNFLWENQVVIAFVLIFIVWFFVRGYDLLRWVIRKVRRRIS